MRLYFDTNAIIQAVEGADIPSGRFSAVVDAAAKTGLKVVTSELSLAELLVKPLREQDFKLIVIYNNLLAGTRESQLETLPVSREILGLSARIRNRKPKIKLPDAIHIATAEHAGCKFILTGDKRLEGATALGLVDPSSSDINAFIEMMS
ncbi:type II toxin-antitoxin system VapC family toxin [Xanthobacter autotrophicus]|uniref:type II toxin-antitoxin system VapC family toxin n=1 Tax=Xanthobacter autotrophicus TaxID=280 RepID=UPI0037264538